MTFCKQVVFIASKCGKCVLILIQSSFTTPDPWEISDFFHHPEPMENFRFFSPPRTHGKFQIFFTTPDPWKISDFLLWNVKLQLWVQHYATQYNPLLSLFHPRLHVCPNTSLFASASNDGTVKLWDTQRVEKQGMVVKSCFTFQLQQGETATRK
jgi:WD40 repeat protein